MQLGDARDCAISVSDDGQYIIMKFQRDMSRSYSMEWNLQAHALGRRLGINRYLVDLRHSRNIEPTAEGYRLVHSDLKKADGIDKTARVAVVVSPGDESHNYIEVLARNAGLDITIFNSLNLAQKHLLA